MGSSRWTVSPTFLSHLVSVPSVMDSPICGMGISVPGPEDEGGAGAAVPGEEEEVPSDCGVEDGAASEPTRADGAGTDGAPGFVAAPDSLIEQTIVPTETVAPSWTLISPSVPAAGEGISASTLSVEISKSGSSRETVSPGLFSHLVSVPSVMDSPIWGITTSVGIGGAPGTEVRRAGRNALSICLWNKGCARMAFG